MKSIKILHCADIHIGMEQSSIGNKSRQRQEEILMTFDRIISICKNEKIELLLIAGDLFDRNNIETAVINSVKNSLKSITETIVAIAPGNHDNAASDSAYLDADWSENVHIFTSNLQSIEFKDKGFRLSGGAFISSYANEPILQSVDTPDDDLINIGIIHGDLVSDNQSSTYNPITPAQIKQSGMDYLALGHIHKRTEILKSGNTFYAYSGCPEGQGFDELGEKGVYIGSISKGSCNLAFRPVCQRMNIQENVDITGAGTIAEASEKILKAIKNKYGKGFSNNLYKIILEGEIDQQFNIDCTAVATRLTDEVFFVKIIDETRIHIDVKALSLETTLKGIFARKMLEKINSAINNGKADEEKEYRRALYIGLKAFDCEVKYNEN